MKPETWEDRKERAENLAQKVSGDTYLELLSLARDKEQLVRIEALESLVNYKEFLQENDISFLLNDPSSLVRAVAIELYSNFPGAKNKILEYCRNQRSSYVRLGAYYALYQLGEKQYLEHMIKILLNSHQYRIRIRTTHILTSLLNKNNFRTILNAFKKALDKENTFLKAGLPYAAKAVCYSLVDDIQIIEKRYTNMLKNTALGNGL